MPTQCNRASTVVSICIINNIQSIHLSRSQHCSQKTNQTTLPRSALQSCSRRSSIWPSVVRSLLATRPGWKLEILYWSSQGPAFASGLPRPLKRLHVTRVWLHVTCMSSCHVRRPAVSIICNRQCSVQAHCDNRSNSNNVDYFFNTVLPLTVKLWKHVLYNIKICILSRPIVP